MIIVKLLTPGEINRFLLLARGSYMRGDWDSFRGQPRGFAICKFTQGVFGSINWYCRLMGKLPPHMRGSPIFIIDEFVQALKRSLAHGAYTLAPTPEADSSENSSYGVFTSTPGNPAPCLVPSKECHCKNLLAGHEKGCYLYK